LVPESELGAAWPMGLATELESELELALGLARASVLPMGLAREWALELVLVTGLAREFA
jgi:hypothetical protein